MGIKGKLKEILYIKESPHHLALSFSIGVLIAISPFLGLHTVLGVVACFLYRFNKFALFVGVYITNPWTIIPIYTFCIWVGAHLTGVELGAIEVDWANTEFLTILEDLETLVLPFVVGSTVVSVVVALLSYPLFRSAVVKAQSNREDLGSIGTGGGEEAD